MSKDKGKPKEPELTEREMREKHVEDFQKAVADVIDKYQADHGFSAHEIINVLLVVMKEVSDDAVDQELDEFFEDKS